MRPTKRIWGLAAVTVFGAWVVRLPAETAEKPKPAEEASDQPKAGFPYVGEATGDSVYVRCRPDQNWYPTTRLKRGDRVEVFGEQFGWLKIRPPRGSFCYIDKTLVTREGADKGVVNADNVYVRAGSDIQEHARKKTGVVTQLSKGAEVKILGEHPDGYYQIVPPKDAYYWVSQAFIRKVGAGKPSEAEEETVTKAPREHVEPSPPPSEPAPKQKPESAKPRAERTETPEAVRPSESAEPVRLMDVWQKKLDLVDAELKAAFRQQPPREADLRSLRKQLEPIADQNEEDVPREYAKIRILQIDDVLERIAIRSRIEQITRSVPEIRKASAAAASVSVTAPPRPDYEGKLMQSFAFEGRYRIVDPADGKTLVYLEVPPEAGIDIKEFVGRIVKVRAKEKRFDKEARRNVVIPAEIVLGESGLGVKGVTTSQIGPTLTPVEPSVPPGPVEPSITPAPVEPSATPEQPSGGSVQPVAPGAARPVSPMTPIQPIKTQPSVPAAANQPAAVDSTK